MANWLATTLGIVVALACVCFAGWASHQDTERVAVRLVSASEQYLPPEGLTPDDLAWYRTNLDLAGIRPHERLAPPTGPGASVAGAAMQMHLTAQKAELEANLAAMKAEFGAINQKHREQTLTDGKVVPRFILDGLDAAARRET